VWVSKTPGSVKLALVLMVVAMDWGLTGAVMLPTLKGALSTVKGVEIHPHVDCKVIRAKIPKGVVRNLHAIIHAIEVEPLSDLAGGGIATHESSIVLPGDV